MYVCMYLHNGQHTYKIYTMLNKYVCMYVGSNYNFVYMILCIQKLCLYVWKAQQILFVT